jgi:hypothetical protein
MLHSDFSPLENGYEYETIKKIKDKDGVEREVKQEKGPCHLYNDYWEKYEFFPLSALYFPEGGLLHLIQCFPDAIISNQRRNYHLDNPCNLKDFLF